jgi:hypothetical protein
VIKPAGAHPATATKFDETRCEKTVEGLLTHCHRERTEAFCSALSRDSCKAMQLSARSMSRRKEKQDTFIVQYYCYTVPKTMPDAQLIKYNHQAECCMEWSNSLFRGVSVIIWEWRWRWHCRYRPVAPVPCSLLIEFYRPNRVRTSFQYLLRSNSTISLRANTLSNGEISGLCVHGR